MTISIEQARRFAGFEINALYAAGTLGAQYEKVAVPKAGTPIYDLNGELLYYRLSLSRGKSVSGYCDLAANEAFGEPLLSTSIGQPWNEATLKKIGISKAKQIKRNLKYDTVRFVAYSHPKIALQFLLSGKEVLMLELYSWVEVPQKSAADRKKLEPSNFERWSFLEELPSDRRNSQVKNFNDRIKVWGESALKRIDPSIISKKALPVNNLVIKLSHTQEIHYSQLNSDHHPCYELRGQQTNVWCVAASCEMLLNFYRYHYTQVRLAAELGLGTLAHPNGLPYANVGLVVTKLESLTSNALDVTMHTNPGWNVFHDEIAQNRPLISFVPGHSRTVAGFTHTIIDFFHPILFKGLLVYDPWPPTTGVITKWENFATHTYQYTYSSVLRHI